MSKLGPTAGHTPVPCNYDGVLTDSNAVDPMDPPATYSMLMGGGPDMRSTMVVWVFTLGHGEPSRGAGKFF